MLQNCNILLQNYLILQKTSPVLLCTAKYYPSSALYCKILLLQYYFRLQFPSPVLVCIGTILQYYFLLQERRPTTSAGQRLHAAVPLQLISYHQPLIVISTSPKPSGAPKGKRRGRSQKDKAPSKSSKGKGKDTPLRPVLLRLHDLRARVQAKLSNTILRPLVISCATRAFHLGTSADRRGTKLQEATLMVSMFSFLVQCCAHHHDSGSLCNLCLRSEIQEWREMGPAEESKNENNNTTNPPQHHKTEPTYWTT